MVVDNLNLSETQPFCPSKLSAPLFIRIPSVPLTNWNRTSLPTPRPEPIFLLLASLGLNRFVNDSIGVGITDADYGGVIEPGDIEPGDVVERFDSMRG